MVDAVVQILVQNLNDLIQRKFDLVWGVQEEIHKLSSTLSTIEAVLEDAEIKQFADKSIANWLWKLKDTAYDAVDVLDEWLTLAQPTKNTTHVSSTASSCLSLKQVKFHHHIAKKIKKIITKFNEIAEERLNFHLTPVVGQQNEFQWDEGSETSSTLTEDIIYGRDVEKEKIIDLLLTNVKHGEEVSVFSIVGIGGLGKTTLAQLVYQDQRVVEHFDARIWVYVSEKFDVKRLTKMVLESLTDNACDLKSLDPIQRQLQENLSGKKLLLVLDDLWNEDPEKWQKLKFSLSCPKGSLILVTTCLETVASIVGTFPSHHLTFLSEEDCWSLFKGRAFGAGSEESAEFVEIGKEIARKCGGIPLAAKVLGGSMLFKREVKYWLHVRDSEIWELPQHKESGILPSLRLSYNHLPSQLRQCFAFCSLYQKDKILSKKELIHMWMANGFLQSDGRMQLEDYGNLIFNELLQRSFFQDIKKDDIGEIISCKIHDLVYDFACSVSANEFSAVKVSKTCTLRKGIRHCSLLFDLPEAVESSNLRSLLQSSTSLHTLILHGYCKRFEPPKDIFRNRDCLRVLDLSETAIQMLPVSIGKMKHLRHLDLSGTGIRWLPESICNLKNLQSLILIDCVKLQNLPKHTSKMSCLRHLAIGGCDSLTQMPIGMRKLKHLQTLNIFVVGLGSGRKIEELQGLNDINGEVEIKDLEHVRNSEEAKEANLSRKENITSLKLYWSKKNEVSGDLQEKVLEGLQPHPSLKVLSICEYKGTVLPSWLVLLPNLVKISLDFCGKCESLPPLGKLPFLKVLTIDGFDSVKCIGDEFFGDTGSVIENFPSLEELSISMYGLEEWSSFSSEVNPRKLFHCLKKLTIADCPKLTAFPFLPSVQYLCVCNCNEIILRSLGKLTPCLHKLKIWGFEELVSFQEGTFINFTALQSLEVRSCDKLKSIPREIENLTLLTSLDILECRELVSVPEGLQKTTSLANLCISDCDNIKCFPMMGIHGLKNSLLQLWIFRCAKLMSLSEGLQNLKSLQKLHIKDCPQLELSMEDFQHLISLRTLILDKLPQLSTLPEGIQHLTMIQDLRICDCKNLRMFPDWLQQITTLQYLEIEDGHSSLHRRCQQEKGEDWHKISHIPEINICRSLPEPLTSTRCPISLLNKLTNKYIHNNNSG